MEPFVEHHYNYQQSLPEIRESNLDDDGKQHLQLSSLSNYWSLTASKKIVCPFVWAIENFSFFLGKDDTAVHRSTTFVDPLTSLREWYLTMECRKKADKERQTLFTIRMTSDELTNLKAKIHFSFLDNHGKLLIDKESEDICNFTGNDQGWSWNIPYKYLTELVYGELKSSTNASDRFIVRCQVTLLSGTKAITSCKRKDRFEIPPCRQVENLGAFYGVSKYADLQIVVGGVTLTAHKIVVASQSPVFAAMLEHETKEAIENRIIIEDISTEVFQQMLAFMYTGKVEAIEQNPFDLLVAANKYGLDRLKALCEKALSAQLTVHNTAAILMLADMHNANQLKEFIIDFINESTKEVLSTSGWKSLAQSNGLLVSEVFGLLMAKSHSARSYCSLMPSKRKIKTTHGDYHCTK